MEQALDRLETQMVLLARRIERAARTSTTFHHMDRAAYLIARTLDEIDFHKGRSPTTVLLRLRRLYLRAQPDERELRILHGILTDTERMARLAREK